jgi:RND family efflux transporter MFP subunit
MRLVPDEEAEAPAEHVHGGAMAPAAAPPAGAIHISPEKQQLIGVTFAVVEFGGASQTLRANGKVAVDETRIAKVQTRIDGWVERVFVDFTGKAVEKGQPLLTLYSPEMLASQQEYLLALRSRDVLRDSPMEGAARRGDSLLAASRRRLELWDLTPDQIAEVERSGKPLTNITLHAPIGGYVTARNAFPKQRVTPETELYTITDLSRVWIFADVFENEAHMIHLGTPARLSAAYASIPAMDARVTYIQPSVDPVTRTLKIRLEADNPGLRLKPEMFVDVEFRVARPRALTVPVEAVLDSGLRKTVFLDRGNGYLEQRQVETGERRDGRVEILSGLKAGERVVASGNFLIDSESRLRGPAAAGGGHSHD